MGKIPTDFVGLASYLQTHVEAETGALEAYEKILKGRDDDMISYILRLILNDEERHHKAFTEIANSLESRIQWEDIQPALPPTPRKIDDSEAIVTATDRLLELEEEDLKELRDLRRSWMKSKGEFGTWAILVKAAEFDTKKHIFMLKQVRKLALNAAKS